MLFFVSNHGGWGLYGNGYTHHCWSPTSLSAIQFSHHPYRYEWRGIHRQCYTTFLQQFETKIQQLDSIMDSCTAIQHANHAIQQSVDCIVSMQQFLKAHTTTNLSPLVHHRNSIDDTVEHHPAHHNMTTKDKKSQPTNSHKLQAMSLLLHHETLTVTPPHTLPHPVHALHSITRRSPSMANCCLFNWTCNNDCSKSCHDDDYMSNPNKNPQNSCSTPKCVMTKIPPVHHATLLTTQPAPHLNSAHLVISTDLCKLTSLHLHTR